MINSLRKTHMQPDYVPVPIDVYARRLLSDNRTVKKVLDFEPKISLREGIQRVIACAESTVKDDRDLAGKQMYFKTL